jgi:hypothetical protein
MMLKLMEQARKSTRDAFLVVAGFGALCFLVLLFIPENLELLRYWDWRVSELHMFIARQLLFLCSAAAFGICAYGLSRHWPNAIHISLLLCAGMALMFFAVPYYINPGIWFLCALMVITLPFAIYLEFGYWNGLVADWGQKT